MEPGQTRDLHPPPLARRRRAWDGQDAPRTCQSDPQGARKHEIPGPPERHRHEAEKWRRPWCYCSCNLSKCERSEQSRPQTETTSSTAPTGSTSGPPHCRNTSRCPSSWRTSRCRGPWPCSWWTMARRTASISARNCSRRVTFFFIASRRPGKASCFGISGAPRGDAKFYQTRRKMAGSSDVPIECPGRIGLWFSGFHADRRSATFRLRDLTKL